MLLRQNNAAVVIEEATSTRSCPSPRCAARYRRSWAASNRPLPPGFSVVVVPLKYVGAKEMVKLLQPFAADNTIIPDETRNLVIVAGGQREMQHLIDAIELFDVDWLAGYSVGLFPVKSADVKSLTAGPRQDLRRHGRKARSPASCA